MSRSSRKTQLLRQESALNPRAAAVTDPLFQQSEFFDPADLLQVKYEMLRQVHREGQLVSEAARAFGLSRPSFYQAQAAFEEAGLRIVASRRTRLSTAQAELFYGVHRERPFFDDLVGFPYPDEEKAAVRFLETLAA